MCSDFHWLSFRFDEYTVRRYGVNNSVIMSAWRYLQVRFYPEIYRIPFDLLKYQMQIKIESTLWLRFLEDKIWENYGISCLLTSNKIETQRCIRILRG